jgi:hypothetical protein
VLPGPLHLRAHASPSTSALRLAAVSVASRRVKQDPGVLERCFGEQPGQRPPFRRGVGEWRVGHVDDPAGVKQRVVVGGKNSDTTYLTVGHPVADLAPQGCTSATMSCRDGRVQRDAGHSARSVGIPTGVDRRSFLLYRKSATDRSSDDLDSLCVPIVHSGGRGYQSQLLHS